MVWRIVVSLLSADSSRCFPLSLLRNPLRWSCYNALDRIFRLGHNAAVGWEVEFTDDFGAWWDTLTEDEQARIDASVRLLEEYGPALDHPHTSSVEQSKHSRMRELRVQIGGRPFRVLYAFDLNRTVILLIGGDKTGDARWYEVNVPVADRLFDQHIEELKKEKALKKETSDG
jgi:hypothetical protein